MKGRTKKQRRSIGKVIRKIRKLQKEGFDRFVLDKVFKRIVAIKSTEVPQIGTLKPAPIRSEHDDSVMAFQTLMYTQMLSEESKKKAFAMPFINNVDQIYT